MQKSAQKLSSSKPLIIDPQVLEPLREMVFTLDRRGNVEQANQAAFRIFGYTKKDLDKGINILDLITPKEKNKAKNHFNKIIKGKKVKFSPYTALKKDGSTFPMLVNGKLIRDSGGKPQNIIGVAIDITDYKNLEEKLKEVEKEYKTVFDTNGSAVAIINKEDTISMINPEFEKLSGYSKREVEGKLKWTKFISPLDLKRLRKYHQIRMVNPQKAPKDYKFKFVDRQGQEREVFAKVSLISGTKESIASLIDISIQNEIEGKLTESLEELTKTLEGTINIVASIVEKRDPYTSGHQKRVAKLANAIAQEMKLTEDRLKAINIAASIHDLGKISTPAEILSKPDHITEAEFSIIKEHPQIAYDIINLVDFPLPVAEIILEHHERVDGTGYPQGLNGNEILLEAKILAVADVVEAMASHRPYRPALGIKIALIEIKKESGIYYDPQVVSACLKVFGAKKFSFA